MPCRRRALIQDLDAFYEKSFSNRSLCLPWEGLLYECLASLEKYRDGKDIDVLLDVVFVICMIYGSTRDMVVKDSENMRL